MIWKLLLKCLFCLVVWGASHAQFDQIVRHEEGQGPKPLKKKIGKNHNLIQFITT